MAKAERNPLPLFVKFHDAVSQPRWLEQQPESGPIRRINRLPIAVVIVCCWSCSLALSSMASRRADCTSDETEALTRARAIRPLPMPTSSSAVSRTASSESHSSRRPSSRRHPKRNRPMKIGEPFTPQPEQQTVQRQAQELEAEAVWRARLAREQQEQILREQQRQRMARLQANNAAYDAPLAIDRGKLRSGETNDVTADAATRPTTTTRDIAGTSDLNAPRCEPGWAARTQILMGRPRKRTSSTRPQGSRLPAKPCRAAAVAVRAQAWLGHSATLITGINSDLPAGFGPGQPERL